ncbi:MAG: ISAs1 family transposase, partial [Acetobacteraceae bacterium]
SNEITAIPELLEVLDLKGATATPDAMGCERAIATKILEKGADYRVVFKANQGKKFTAVQELCATSCFSRAPRHRPIHDEFDESHGRLGRQSGVARRAAGCGDRRSRDGGARPAWR